MSERNNLGRPDFERALVQAFDELAPAPGPELLKQTLHLIESEPQRDGRSLPVLRPWWGWGATAVLALGIVVGAAVGLSAASLIADEPLPSGPALTGSPTGSADGASGSTPAASGSPVSPPDDPDPGPPHDPNADWERIDLPDPAPGVDGGGRPADIVEFRDHYVVVGSVDGFCGSDILMPAPGCEERLREFTGVGRLQDAAVWISEEARTWELLESSTFERATMVSAATDGERIIVAGLALDPPGILGVSTGGTATIWVSMDGRQWDIAASGSPLPEFVEWTSNGWIGVRNTQILGPGGRFVDGSPQFLESEDGEVWSPVAEPAELGPGRVEDLAVDATGTVIAVGYHSVVTTEGLLDSSTALAWRTTDGRSWELAPEQDALVINGPGGLFMQTVAATSDGWMALGRADDMLDGVGSWTSRDGLTWSRLPDESAPAGESPEEREYVTVAHLLWTDPGLVATGTVAGEGGSRNAVWVSADGETWERVPDQPTLEGGISALIADGDVVIAAGGRYPSTDNYLPVVYLTTR